MIHRYINNGYYIVIDANSGAIHQLDKDSYEILGYIEENFNEKDLRNWASLDDSQGKEKDYTEKNIEINSKDVADKLNINIEDVEETLVDIKYLINEKTLFSEDVFKEAAPILKKQQSVLKAICLHVAHSCNMDCGYCFAGKGEYNGKEQIMTFETGKKAIDFLYENSKDRKNLEVDFFGGEPLLNWQVVKDLVAYGRELEKKGDKNIRFTLTTNGLLLNDEIIEFCKDEMHNVVISLDGRPGVNDNMRKTRNGEGTYEKIIPAFKRMASAMKGKQYYMRGTYTAYNKDFSEDVKHMADLGFKELSMEPVVCDPSMDYALTKEDLPKLFEEYDKLSLEMLKRKKEGKGFKFYHFSIDLEGGPCAAKRISGCGVGTEYLAITPKGEIYPCHQFVGREGYLVGNLDEGIVGRDILAKFENCNIYSRSECEDCFAKLYCSGGCSANAESMNNDIETVDDFSCQLHKKRIECAIMMKVAE